MTDHPRRVPHCTLYGALRKSVQYQIAYRELYNRHHRIATKNTYEGEPGIRYRNAQRKIAQDYLETCSAGLRHDAYVYGWHVSERIRMISQRMMPLEG